jgi:TonB family protein
MNIALNISGNPQSEIKTTFRSHAGGTTTMKRSVIFALLVCLLTALPGAAQSNSSRTVAILSAVAPVYPPIALTANMSGDVQVTVTIDKVGSVMNADFISGSPLLHKAAVEAAKRWKFEGLNEITRVQLIFSFRMVSKDILTQDMTPVFMPPYRIEVRGKLPESTVSY